MISSHLPNHIPTPIPRTFANPDSMNYITFENKTSKNGLPVSEKGRPYNQNNSFNLDLFSDTHTLRIQCEYTWTQCVGGAEEVKIERVILII